MNLSAGFSHLTWLVGKDTAKEWLDDLIGILKQVNVNTSSNKGRY